ncbi:MAG: hypothetical protein AAFQ96_06965, partial [Pseudomonadota bacterium]
QHGQVDLCLVGTDRTTRAGDVANKIGTYLKALAAKDNGVSFYVALPSTTIDWAISDGVRDIPIAMGMSLTPSLIAQSIVVEGVRDIPIEERDAREVTHISGRLENGRVATVDIVASGSPAANYAFDVTPARLVTGLITERGVCAASETSLAALFPEKS